MAVDTTTDDVLTDVDLAGTTALVTGATTGLGLETAASLAAAGAAVIVGARSTEKAEAAKAAIAERAPDATLDHECFDLADLDTVRSAATNILQRHSALNLLINNAGVMFTPEGRTAQGFETQFGTNHLGHFVLTNLLTPALVAGAPARVVNLSSAGHGMSDILWDDPHFDQAEYDKFTAYGQAKTANILFSVELDRRLAASGVRSAAVHPGMIMTDLARHMDESDMARLMERAKANSQSESGGGGMPAFKSIPAGAATSVWAAITPDVEQIAGRYLADTEVSAEVADWAINPDAAVRLWAMSEELVGESFTAPE
jgi:NAD(P)-dependent dehydrogenase (short-subunit alcohol dehydrogenase family)